MKGSKLNPQKSISTVWMCDPQKTYRKFFKDIQNNPFKSIQKDKRE